MRHAFLHYLIDPKTGEDLALESKLQIGDDVIDGHLVSATNRYPIIRGVPRFAGYNDVNNYTQSFSDEWTTWPTVEFESRNQGKPMEGHTLRMWEHIAAIYHRIDGQVIADYGCGPGRFIEIARMKGAKVIGIDMSAAVDMAAEFFRSDPDVLICQADVLQSPIRSGSMDGGFSIGVLHHTANPKTGLTDLARVIKPGGWIAVSVYGPNGYYNNIVMNAYRRTFGLLRPLFGSYPPFIYSYVISYAVYPIARFRRLYQFLYPLLSYFPHAALPDIRWSVLTTFDSVTPNYQEGLSMFHVFQWCRDIGLVDITPSYWKGTSLHARTRE